MENELKNSIKYINSKTGKKSGFTVEANYFDNIEASIDAKIFEEKLSNVTAFKTPNTYFKNLEDSILDKILEEESAPKVVSLKERIFKFIPVAAAASIALFIGINTFVFKNNEEISLDTITDDEIEYWLDANTLSSTDIAMILEDDIKEENDFSFTNINDESIEDYINSIDNTTLLNELN